MHRQKMFARADVIATFIYNLRDIIQLSVVSSQLSVRFSFYKTKSPDLSKNQKKYTIYKQRATDNWPLTTFLWLNLFVDWERRRAR